MPNPDCLYGEGETTVTTGEVRHAHQIGRMAAPPVRPRLIVPLASARSR